MFFLQSHWWGLAGADEENGSAQTSGDGKDPMASKANGPDESAAKKNGDDEKEASPSQDQYWRKLAERTVQSHCELVAEPESEQKLTQILGKTALQDTHGTPGSDYIAVLVDKKQSGEPITAPHLRTPPFNKKRMTKLLGAVLKARGSVTADSDVFGQWQTRSSGTHECCSEAIVWKSFQETGHGRIQ